MKTELGAAPVPARALLLSLLSLAVPVVSSALFPDWTSWDVGILVWLLALVPGFLLSYYRGWRGASLALAAGMAALSVTQVVILTTDAPLPSPAVLLGVVTVLTAVSLGSGLLASFFHHSLEQAERLALTDPGTGLPNRRHVILEFEKAFAAAQRGSKLAIVLFDLDRFKRVNDEYGHAEGDRVLVKFAEILQKTTRTMNTTARFGGEEFLAIVRNADAEGASVFAERVRTTFRELELHSGPLTVSAGVAAYEPGMATPDVLLAAADQALYRAKHEGRDRVVVLGKQGKLSEEAERPARGDDVDVPQGHGELILVVDDDVDALRSISRTLRRFGYTVLESPSPRRAVDIARGLDRPIDAVLTDIVMPEMGGFRLVEMLEEIQEQVRVLYLSGYSQEEVDWGGVPGAVREYLSKPVSIYHLAHRVRWILDQPATARKRLPGEASEGPRGSDAPSPGEIRELLDRPVGEEARTLVLYADEARGEMVARTLQEKGIRCGAVLDGVQSVLDNVFHIRSDLLVIDLDLERSGLEDLLSVLEKRSEAAPALLFVVGDNNRDLRQRSARFPLVDFIAKPFSLLDMEVRCRNLLRTHSYERWIGFAEEDIRGRVAARTAELEESREEVLRRLALAAEFRDDLTGHHAERVGILSGLIAGRLGLPMERCNTIRKAAPLHDLGKIALPDALLKKAGPLTREEQEVMKRHTTIGGQLLSGSLNPIIRAAEEIALTHHERWDGAGYPLGLSGEDIPESGRIVAVADVFDSLTSRRPYRDEVPVEEALDTIRSARGSQFDPRIVDAFDRAMESDELEEALNLEVVARPDVGT